MKAIWKQVLDKTDKQVVKLPVNSKILDVQVQDDEWCLWFLCRTETPLEERHIVIYGTGQQIDSVSGTYIGTIQDGSLVFHVFEEDE